MNTNTENNDEIIDMDEAIESGDPELMARALAQHSTSDGFSEDDEAVTKADKGDDEGTGNTSSQEEAEAKKVVLSKDGQHEIPYSVLEYERQQRKALEQQLEDVTNRYNSTESALNNVKARLESEGMNTEEMFSDPEAITETNWKEIEEDYGALGKMMRQLVEAQKANTQIINSAIQEDSGNELQEALNANPDLTKWRDGDANRWTEALRLDEQLKQDPAWQGKSITERFAHVVESTKNAFGDLKQTAVERAKQAIDKTGQQLPSSLSEMGSAPTVSKSDIEAMRDMTPEQLEARMAQLSPEEMDKLFASGF